MPTKKTPPDDRITVTDENFGDLLIQSAREALAHPRGKTTEGRVRVRAVPDAPLLPTDANKE